MTNEKACIASKNMSLDILRIVAALMVLMEIGRASCRERV